VSCTAVLATAAAPEGWQTAILDPIALAKSVFALVLGLTTSPIATAWSIGRRLWDEPALAVALGAAFLAAYGMATYADRRMSAVFSRFWHGAQQQLRDALKQARKSLSERKQPSPADGKAAWLAKRADQAEPAPIGT